MVVTGLLLLGNCSKAAVKLPQASGPATVSVVSAAPYAIASEAESVLGCPPFSLPMLGS